MKLYFENIAPFEKRVEFEFKPFTFIQYKNDQLSRAMQLAIDLMGDGDFFRGADVPAFFKAAGNLKPYMLDPDKPVKVGFDRKHRFGSVQADFSFTWDSQLNRAITSDFRFKFNGLTVYHRSMWEAKLFVKGTLGYVAARNEDYRKEMQHLNELEREEYMSLGKGEDLSLYNRISNLPQNIYTITIAPDDENNNPSAYTYPPDCFSFFREESDAELDSAVDWTLREIAFDIPNGAHNHWFILDVKKALDFAHLKRDFYHSLDDIQIPEAQTRLQMACKFLNLPVPKKEEVFDQFGQRIGSAFLIVDTHGVKRSIAHLSTEEQVLYYVIMSLSVFEHWSLEHPSQYDSFRYADLSGLENYLPVDDFFETIGKLKTVFNYVFFVFTTKNNFMLRAFAMWWKQQRLNEGLCRIYRFKNLQPTGPIEKLTIRSDYELNFAVLDTHSFLLSEWRWN